MFFSDFKEKSGKRVPLPEKNYEDMVMFFNVTSTRGVQLQKNSLQVMAAEFNDNR